MTLSRFRYAAGAAVVALLAPLAPSSGADAAVEPPQLQSISYLGPPYARVGWLNQPVATVTLTGPAQGDTTVTVTSDAAAVQVTGGQTTVPDGQTSAPVLVSALAEGTATLTARLGSGAPLTLTPPLQVGGVTRSPNLASLSLDPASVQPGGQAVGTVVLDFLADVGGTTVALSADNPDVSVPASVTVPADQDRATFLVTTVGSGTSVVSATLGSVTKGATLEMADTLPPDTAITGLTVKSARRLATVRFTSTEEGSTFGCRLDGHAWRSCASPQTYRRLARGQHTVRVRATDAVGNADPTPALKRFRIRR